MRLRNSSVFRVVISLILVALSPSFSCTGLGSVTPVRKLLIDTDAGTDDTVGILLALGAEAHGDGPEIIGFTCVNGNTFVDTVAFNVLKTLKVADRLDIPVYKGASHPLLLVDTKDNYFGQDGFGDFYYPDPPSRELIQEKHAVNAMIDLVKSHPGNVTLLALGPLTNVALAIRMHPRFVDDLQQLIIMGGSVEGRGTRGVGLEFNFYTDPIANYVVFSSFKSKPVILVPFETSENNQPGIEFRKLLSKSNSTKMRLIDSSETFIFCRDCQYWDSPDALTSFVAITSGSGITQSATYYIEAIHDGSKTAGMIIVDYTNSTGNAANTNLVQKINLNTYKHLLSKYLTDF